MTARPTPAGALIALNGLSAFGSGLVYPYTALYLTGHPGIGAAGVSVFYGVAAAANLATTAALATGRPRAAPATLGLTGSLLLAAGFLGAATAGTLPLLAAASTLIGGGQACLLIAMVPVLGSLTGPDDRRAVFARRYRALNVGLGLGAVTAGLATGLLALTAVPWLLACNAASYLPLAYAFHRLRRRAAPAPAAPPGPAPASDWGWLRGAAALAVAFQLGAYLFGHSQFEATAPLVSVRLMGIGIAAASGLLLLNTAVVALCQPWTTRALASRSTAFGLRAAAVLWAVSYAFAAVTAFGPLPVRYAGLALFAILFALGECAYSCSFHPWLIAAVPDRHLTRASALTSGAMGVGTAAGPSIGVALVLTGSAPAVWLALSASSLLLLLAVPARVPAPRPEPAADRP